MPLLNFSCANHTMLTPALAGPTNQLSLIFRLRLGSLFLLAAMASPANMLFAQASLTPVIPSFAIEYLGKAEPEIVARNLREAPAAQSTPNWLSLFEMPFDRGRGLASDRARSWDAVNPASPRDPLLERSMAFNRVASAFAEPEYSVDGIPYSNVGPPDPSADVGKDHIVQAVNGRGGAQYLVLDKIDGHVLLGPVVLNTLGSTGRCLNALGDPVVLYDEQAQRWLLTEFAVMPSRTLCLYISSGSDPINTTWTRYEFQTTAFPDYPHYGIWGNSILVTANETGLAGSRPVFAIDRQRILAGQSAGIVRANLPALGGFSVESWTPADHDGAATPVPEALPGIFMRHRDDEAHNPTANNPTQDYLELVQLSVDWSQAMPTGFASAIQQIPISEFSSNLNGFIGTSAFPQPSGRKLDALREFIMQRVAYRRFANYEALLGNFTTDVDGLDTGGIRWFELRRLLAPGSAWALHQEGTHSLGDGADRWMGASAMDQDGNIALSYSIVRESPALFASIRYAGRLSSNALGVLTSTEGVIAAGLGSQLNNRWGDYAQLSVDPEDQCSFIATGSYVGAANLWRTRIAKFRFDSCGGPNFTVAASNLNQSLCALTDGVNAQPVMLNFQPTPGFSAPVSTNVRDGLPVGLSASFSPSSVLPPATMSLQIQSSTSVVPGGKTLVLRSSGLGPNGTINRDLNLNLSVYTQTAGTPSPSVPNNNQRFVSITPTLSWSAAPQTRDYLVQLARDPGFQVIEASTVLAGTSWKPPANLAFDATYYWRVIARNPCAGIGDSAIFANGFEAPTNVGNGGSAASSQVFSFITIPAPGVCPAGTTETIEFADSMDAGAPGWSDFSASAGARWALSSAVPASGVFAYQGLPTANSDMRLVSPPIAIPAGPLSNAGLRSLSFSHAIDLDVSLQTCFDYGVLEVSSDGGITYTQVTQGLSGRGYTGTNAGSASPLSGQPGWCGNNLAHALTAVDLSPYAGQTIRLRYRVISDVVTENPKGWNIDDVKVQTCRP
jgi:hypothetical protein